MMHDLSGPLLSRVPMRALVAVVIVSLFGSRSLTAQENSPVRATMPDSAKALVGTWEGSYTSDHAPPGAMKLVFTRDSVIKLSSMTLAMGGEMQNMPVRNFAVTSTDISWVHELMGMVCQATAVLKNAQMKGALVCDHGSVTFTLGKHE